MKAVNFPALSRRDLISTAGVCGGATLPSEHSTASALRRVRAYIDDHIGERISLDELARQAGVSRSYFARQFRLSTGESPMGYLRRIRIERSKIILQTRATTVGAVAASLGFSDQSHFTRMFSRVVGVPPGVYAKVPPP